MKIRHYGWLAVDQRHMPSHPRHFKRYYCSTLPRLVSPVDDPRLRLNQGTGATFLRSSSTPTRETASTNAHETFVSALQPVANWPRLGLANGSHVNQSFPHADTPCVHLSLAASSHNAPMSFPQLHPAGSRCRCTSSQSWTSRLIFQPAEPIARSARIMSQSQHLGGTTHTTKPRAIHKPTIPIQ